MLFVAARLPFQSSYCSCCESHKLCIVNVKLHYTDVWKMNAKSFGDSMVTSRVLINRLQRFQNCLPCVITKSPSCTTVSPPLNIPLVASQILNFIQNQLARTTVKSAYICNVCALTRQTSIGAKGQVYDQRSVSLRHQ